VRLTKHFELGKYEVTQAQWEAVMGSDSNPSEATGGPNNPVDSVNKAEIQAFLDKLNAQNDGHTCRLPTPVGFLSVGFIRSHGFSPPQALLGAIFGLSSDMKRHDDSNGDPKRHMPPQFPLYCDGKTKHHNERHSTPAGYRHGRRLIRDALD
jgi:hypothetical protein